MTTDNPTPAEAEAGAEQARAGLVSTLSQLRENLKPANVVDEVMGNARVSASAISEQIWDTARKNPLPALMIGAGLAMIFGLGQRALSSGETRPARTPRSPGGRSSLSAVTSPGGPEFAAHISREPGSMNARHDSTMSDAASQGFEAAKRRTADMLGAANERFTSVATRGAGVVSDALRNATQKGDSMTSYSQTRNQLTSSLSKALEEQPLILAAIGLAVGAALGAAIPQTETENSLMGETSGSVRDAAQGLVQDQYAQIKSAASYAVEEMKQTAADHGVTTDNLSGLVHDVGDKARTATYQAGKALDPTT